jgi:hypothetical protein
MLKRDRHRLAANARDVSRKRVSARLSAHFQEKRPCGPHTEPAGTEVSKLKARGTAVPHKRKDI